jgi:hypothetical protein
LLFGRCRFTFALLLVAAMAFTSTTDAAPPEPVTLKKHTGGINGVAFNPDGTVRATMTADTTV